MREDAERERRGWEPVFAHTPVHESETAARVRRGLIAAVGEEGAEGATLDGVLSRAGINEPEFAAEYDTLEETFVDTWVYLIRDYMPRTDAAYERGGGDWREGVRHQAWDLLRYIEDDLHRARFLVLMSGADEMVQANRDIAMSRLADYIHLGRFETEHSELVPRATAEALVGAIWNGVASNIGDPPNPEILHSGPPQILYLTVMAYVGEETAREELARAEEDLARYERGEL
jgi:hypothetical protein